MTEQDPTPASRTREEIRATKRTVEDSLIARPGVVGVDIGEKWSGGSPTGRQAIVVHVERKRTDSDLADSERIPSEIDGILTDVVEHRVRLLSGGAATPTTHRVRPLAGGISIGPATPVTVPVDGEAQLRSVNGTLGVLVYERHTGKTFGLTNWHVAAGDGLGTSRAPGCSPRWPTAATRAPTGWVRSCAARSQTASTPRSWHSPRSAVPARDRRYRAVRGRPGRPRGDRPQGRPHQGLTRGTITSTDYTTSVDFGPGIGWKTLRDQIRIEPADGAGAFSAEGDSGPAIVTEDGTVVGLLWAGEDDGSFSVANPIRAVLDTLGVDVLTPAVAQGAGPA